MPFYHVWIEYFDGESRWGEEKNLTLEQLKETVSSIKERSPFLLGGRRIDSSHVTKLEIRKTEAPTNRDWNWIRYYGEMVTKDFIVSLSHKVEDHSEQADDTSFKKTILESSEEDPHTCKNVKVLFLAANPIDTSRLQLDKECREIEHRILLAQKRDFIALVNKGAVRIGDLQLYLNQEKPTIVHFSGHGSKDSRIILEDNLGNARDVPPEALERMFDILKDNIKCVVLNACFSFDQARAISRHIDCVIGMSSSVKDEAAIAFSAAFYLAIASGRSVKNAFDQGVTELMLWKIPGDNIPQLLTRNGEDASAIFLLEPKPSTEKPLKSKPSVPKPAGMKSDNGASKFKKARVFISYAHEDTNAAMKIFEELKTVPGIEPWIDKECLWPGMKWRPVIRKAIRESRFFVAVLSRNSVLKKGYFQRELNEALEIYKEFPEDQVFLIPVRLEQCEPPTESLTEIHFVDLFPNWNEGMKRVHEVIDQHREQATVAKEKSQRYASYEFRCAILDLDTGLTNIAKITERLNEIQHFFLFTSPKITLDIEAAITKFDGSQNLFIDKLPRLLYEQMPYLNVDFVVCLTKYPIAFGLQNSINYNYFSRPSLVDERFMFISTHRLYEFAKQANCTFEKGVVHMMIGQLLVYFTESGYHRETRECVMDFCENRNDIVKGLRRKRLCEECSGKIKNPSLERAVAALLSDELRV